MVGVCGAPGGPKTDLVCGQGDATRAGQQTPPLLETEVRVGGGRGQGAVSVLIPLELERLVPARRVLVPPSPHFLLAGLHPLVVIVILLLVTALSVTVLGVLGESPGRHPAAVTSHPHALLQMRRKPRQISQKI